MMPSRKSIAALGRLIGCALLLAAAPRVHAERFLLGYDEAPTLAQALEQVAAQPDRHVLVYADMSRRCPSCEAVRAILNSETVREQWRRHYVVVSLDLWAPGPAERELIRDLNLSWAPVLVFLDGKGRRVTYARELSGADQARLLDEFVSRRLYALAGAARLRGQHFDAAAARMASESRFLSEQRASGEAWQVTRIDDRPRLSQVLARQPVRPGRADLIASLSGRVMYKENQQWFLDLDLEANGMLRAKGRRKDGLVGMQGNGKWYVTKKGKLCIELTAGGVDENWCRHVFKVGEGYYVSKDLRPNRVVYRFVLGER